jgi:WXG100 family type VII secretion target
VVAVTSGVQVSHEHLAETSRAFDQHTTVLFDLRSKLSDHVEQAVQQWSGQAGDAVKEAGEAFEEAFGKIARTLQEITDKLAAAGDSYAQQEEENAHNLAGSINLGEDKFSDGRDGKTNADGKAGDGKTEAAALVDADDKLPAKDRRRRRPERGRYGRREEQRRRGREDHGR